MGDLDKQIKLKLTIDGKEAIATLDMTDKKFAGILAKSRKLAGSNKAAGNSFKPVTTGSSAARMTISQFGYALGDASMATVNLRMALMGVGNNFPFIIQGLAQVSKEAKSAGMSMGKYLKGNFDTSMKMVLGANLLMFALQVLPPILEKIFASSSNLDSKIKELNKTMGDEEKKVRQQQLEFNSLIGVLKDTTIAEKTRQEALVQLKEKYPDYISFLKDEKVSTEKIAEALEKGNIQFKKKIKLAASERILKEYYEQATQADYDIQKLEDKRERIQKQFDEGNKSRGFSLAAIDSDLQSLEEKKQSAINKIQKFNIEITKLNSGIIGTNKNSIKTLTEDQKAKIDFQVGDITLEQYQKHLQNRLKIIKGKSYEEKQIIIELRNELARLNEDYKSPNIELPEKIDDADQMLPDVKFGNALDYARLTKQQELDLWKKTEEEKIKAYENKDEMLKAIDEEYKRRQQEINRDVVLSYINGAAQIVNTIANAYNQIYNTIQNNAREEIGEWKNKEEKKLEEERKAALKHARTQAQRERIDEQYNKKKDALDDEANAKAKERLAAWFYINQAVSASNAVINSIAAGIATMKTLSEALIPPPLPQIAMGVTIAAGLAQAAIIAQQKLPGYARGGAVVGEDGPEIIAPFQDYASGQAKLIAMTMQALKYEIRSGAGYSSNFSHADSELRNEIKGLRNDINYLMKNPTPAVAYLNDREAGKIWRKGSAINRKSKI